MFIILWVPRKSGLLGTPSADSVRSLYDPFLRDFLFVFAIRIEVGEERWHVPQNTLLVLKFAGDALEVIFARHGDHALAFTLPSWSGWIKRRRYFPLEQPIKQMSKTVLLVA